MLFLLFGAAFLGFSVSICKMWSFSTPFRIVGLQKINLPRTALIHRRALINSISLPALCSGNGSDFVSLLICLLGWLIWVLLSLFRFGRIPTLLKIKNKKMPLKRGACLTLEDREGRGNFVLSICVSVKSCRAGSGMVVLCSQGECVKFAGVSLTVHLGLANN